MIAPQILRRPRRQLPRCGTVFPPPSRGIRFSCVSYHASYLLFFLSLCIQIVENFENKPEPDNSVSDGRVDRDIELEHEAKRNLPEPQDYTYSERDVILYNLSIGATEQELHWTFENHEDFSPLPTFGVIPQFMTSFGISLDFLPNFNPVRTLLASRL